MNNYQELFNYLGFQCPKINDMEISDYQTFLEAELKEVFRKLPREEIINSMHRPTDIVSEAAEGYHKNTFRKAVLPWLAEISELSATKSQSTRSTIHTGLESLINVTFSLAAMTACHSLGAEYALERFVKVNPDVRTN